MMQDLWLGHLIFILKALQSHCRVFSRATVYICSMRKGWKEPVVGPAERAPPQCEERWWPGPALCQ